MAFIRAGLVASGSAAATPSEHLERAGTSARSGSGAAAASQAHLPLAGPTWPSFTMTRTVPIAEMGAALDLVDEESDPPLASRLYLAYAGWAVELLDR